MYGQIDVAISQVEKCHKCEMFTDVLNLSNEALPGAIGDVNYVP